MIDKLIMNDNLNQGTLFSERCENYLLPGDYVPMRPDHLTVARIYLAKGSLSTPDRRRFVERICSLYPEAQIVECLDTPHNRIDLNETDPLALHRTGKKTVVFGELKNAVRFSEEKGNSCPNYWHFSPFGFCPFGCKYCYLAGTQGVKFFPAIKVYVNLPEMLVEIGKIASRSGKPTPFYIGKLQDALALDPLTAYSGVMIPFFAKHTLARLVLLTKSSHIERLLELEHNGHTVLTWSVNPPEICSIFEENVPDIEARLEAMCLVAQKGYPIRAVMMPVIPIDGWQGIYKTFTERLVRTVPIKRLTIGGICIYRGARNLMERKMGVNNVISISIAENSKGGDGRERYSKELRKEAYSLILETARNLRPDLELALCLEEKELWQNTGLENRLGRCNCVL